MRAYGWLQHLRSTGKLSGALKVCLDRDDVFGDWVDEKARILDRMERVDREGGVRIWSRRFLDNHSPWLETNHNHALEVERKQIREDGRLDPQGVRYRRRSFFRGVGYRITSEGFAWTNFVLGLEPLDGVRQGCADLAAEGVVPGASVLHFDEGATVRDAVPPTYDEVLAFYDDMADLYRSYDFRPFFSSRALRSSLANEAYAGRF